MAVHLFLGSFLLSFLVCDAYFGSYYVSLVDRKAEVPDLPSPPDIPYTCNLV